MPVNPASLQNITPWSSKTAPRNGGRPKGFVSLTDYVKSLSCTAVPELVRISKDPNEPAFKIGAAIQILTQCGLMEGTRPSDRLASFGELADRTEGKAAQTQRIEHTMGDSRPALIDKAKFEEANRIAADKKSGPELIEQDEGDEEQDG